MALRQSKKITTLALIPGLQLDLNPFAQLVGSARILENFFYDQGKLTRRHCTPYFSAMHSTHSGYTGNFLRRLVNFRYRRANADENKLIIFDTTGKVWNAAKNWMQPVFPGTTSFSAMNEREAVWTLSNRMFFSDGTNKYVYDGLSVQAWGMARSTTAPTVSAVAAGSLTAATGLKAAITWVVLDEEGNRVHEGSRSNVSGFQVLAAENLQVDITALTPPARATHWSAYVSELNGSEVLRRSATTRITTLTVDISSLPAATSPKAPIRNDPPPAGRVGCVAKNRIIIRDEANPNTFYFSALGEVKGLLNGAPDESFPGYGTNSISDITNSDFIPDREIRCIVEHDNNIFIFSESKGYVLIGELNLLDNRAPRSLLKLQQFTEGCIGPNAAVSTPYGLVWMSPGRKLWLWDGSGLIDLGEPIQARINLFKEYGLTDNLFDALRLSYYGGNGRAWLLMYTEATASLDAPTGFTSGAVFIYDFQHPSTTGQGKQKPGSWFEWIPGSGADSYLYASPASFQDAKGNVFLLSCGSDSGTSLGIIVLDSPFQPSAPCHLDHSSILGGTYLGATLKTIPASTLRTGLIAPNGDQWANVQYLQLQTLIHSFNETRSTASYTEPTVNSWVDIEDPDNAGTAIALTLDTATTSGDKRAWLKPQSTGNTNVGGALGKQFVFELIWSATESEDIDATASRTTPVIYSIGKWAMAFTPLKELTV